MITLFKVRMLGCMLLLLASHKIFDFAEGQGLDLSQISMDGLGSKLPSEISNTNLTLDDAKALLQDKCVQTAGAEKGKQAYEEIEAGTGTVIECITGILNHTAILLEIEEAKPRGELDVVFNKYCNKRPQVLDCVESFNSKLVPCLDEEERKNQDVVMRIARSLLNFICHKGGDQIALFIAEKGPECLTSKWDNIQQCINNTFSDYIPKDGIENIKSLPKLVLSQKQCNDIQKLEVCIVEELERCDEITPANIVESMFRFIKNETICRTSSSNTLAEKQLNAKSAADNTLLISLNSCIWVLLAAVFFMLGKRLHG